MKLTKGTVAIFNLVALALIVSISMYQRVTSANAGTDKNKVKIYEKEGYRYIESNGIPNHETGAFPNRGNPNRISSQKYKFKIPLKPSISSNSSKPRDERRGRRGPPPLFGVAINGIPFDPGTAEAWNNDRRSGWNNEALTGKLNLGIDKNNAHVQPTGAYHYHGIPIGLINKLIGEQSVKKVVLIGYAADGFPVYSQYGYTNADDSKSEIKKLTPSYRLKSGTRSSGPRRKIRRHLLSGF